MSNIDEGQQYRVGRFEVEGNRRFSTDEVLAYYRSSPTAPDGRLCSRPSRSDGPDWESARSKLQISNSYAVLYANMTPEEAGEPGRTACRSSTCAGPFAKASRRRSTRSSILGNDEAHERVIRGRSSCFRDLFRRDG